MKDPEFKTYRLSCCGMEMLLEARNSTSVCYLVDDGERIRFSNSGEARSYLREKAGRFLLAYSKILRAEGIKDFKSIRPREFQTVKFMKGFCRDDDRYSDDAAYWNMLYKTIGKSVDRIAFEDLHRSYDIQCELIGDAMPVSKRCLLNAGLASCKKQGKSRKAPLPHVAGYLKKQPARPDMYRDDILGKIKAFGKETGAKVPVMACDTYIQFEVAGLFAFLEFNDITNVVACSMSAQSPTLVFITRSGMEYRLQYLHRSKWRVRTLEHKALGRMHPDVLL